MIFSGTGHYRAGYAHFCPVSWDRGGADGGHAEEEQSDPLFRYVPTRALWQFQSESLGVLLDVLLKKQKTKHSIRGFADDDDDDDDVEDFEDEDEWDDWWPGLTRRIKTLHCSWHSKSYQIVM